MSLLTFREVVTQHRQDCKDIINKRSLGLWGLAENHTEAPPPLSWRCWVATSRNVTPPCVQAERTGPTGWD
eukprot:824544-Pyramimonas_sp.AAC.1